MLNIKEYVMICNFLLSNLTSNIITSVDLMICTSVALVASCAFYSVGLTSVCVNHLG